mmetsp:Transcript_19955/g.29718  ORF Transcript_19955/g.29718 Transcript_19955/m.29718 type:complete len:127 (-) Transcript_19955:58-438(-)
MLLLLTRLSHLQVSRTGACRKRIGLDVNRVNGRAKKFCFSFSLGLTSLYARTMLLACRGVFSLERRDKREALFVVAVVCIRTIAINKFPLAGLLILYLSNRTSTIGYLCNNNFAPRGTHEMDRASA